MAEEEEDYEDEEEEEEDEEESELSPLVVLIPIGVLILAFGIFLILTAVLGSLNIGPFPGLLNTISGVLGFYPKDTVYVLGMFGVSFSIVSLIVLGQGFK